MDREKVGKVLFACLLLIALGALFSISPAFAEDSSANMKTLFTNLIKLICKIFRGVGLALCVYSAAQLVLALRNDNPDTKVEATRLLMVSFCLIFLETFVNSLNLSNLMDFSIK